MDTDLVAKLDRTITKLMIILVINCVINDFLNTNFCFASLYSIVRGNKMSNFYIYSIEVNFAINNEFLIQIYIFLRIVKKSSTPSEQKTCSKNPGPKEPHKNSWILWEKNF